MTSANWTPREEDVARHAFHNGNQRCIKVLIKNLQAKSQSLNSAECIWKLHDFLSTERHNFEGRAEFDYNSILFTLADMLKQQLISIEELEGLDQQKLAKIKAMSLF